MTRPGWLVHAEHDARDKAEREGIDDPRPDRDELPPDEPVSIWCDGCAVCRAIARDWRRLGWA